MWWSKKKEPKEKDKWEISARDAVIKYGSATKALEKMYHDFPVAGFDGVTQLIYMSMREEYFRKNPE